MMVSPFSLISELRSHESGCRLLFFLSMAAPVDRQAAPGGPLQLIGYGLSTD